MEKTSKERRIYPRMRLSTDINLYPKGSIILKDIGKLRDLSFGGMNVELDSKLKPGTVIYLQADLPIELKGALLRVQKTGPSYRYGVKFEGINYGKKLKLKYITTKSLTESGKKNK